MSDYPQGTGWWQASDGRWYPPQEPTAAQPQTSPPYPPYPGPPPQPKSKAPLIAILVAVAVVAAAVVGFVIVAADDDEETVNEATTTEADDEDATTIAEEGGDLDVDVPDGFVPVVNEDEGFAIALSEEWEEFDLSDPAVQSRLDEFADDNPQLGGAIDQAGGIINAGGVLLALDPNRTPFSPNVNIVKSPGEIDLELLESTVVGQLEPLGARNISTEFVDLPAAEALAIEYDLTVNQPDGSTIDAHGVQFQVPAEGSTWAITMTTDDIGRDGDLFDQMIQSFAVAG